MQLNNRVYAVGGLTAPPNSLQWSSVSDQQKMDERERQSHHGDVITNYQECQQQVHEHADADRQAAKSPLQIPTITSTAVANAGAGRCFSTLAVSASSQAGAATSVNEFLTSWSGGQTHAVAWVGPSTCNVQPARGPCEAASVAQQMISRHQVTAEEHSCDDKLMFEDGLVHLRKLYEAQLASSR